MYEAHINLFLNRLYLVVAGRMEKNELKFFTEAALVESQKLRPGFGVITDISEFPILFDEKLQILENFMKSLKHSGVGTVVRVVNPRAAMVTIQWQRLSQKAGYSAFCVTSLQDADLKLDEIDQTSMKMAVVPA